MNSAVLSAAAESAKPRTITTPKGYKLKWTKPTDPTAEDWARLKEWDDAQMPNPAVGAQAGLLGKNVKPKSPQHQMAPYKGTMPTARQIAAFDAKMESDYLFNVSDDDLGKMIEDTYKDKRPVMVSGRSIPEIREKLLTERQRRLGQVGDYALPPGLRQVAAYVLNLPEQIRSSVANIGHSESSVGDTIIGSADIMPIPIANEIIHATFSGLGKLGRGIANKLKGRKFASIQDVEEFLGKQGLTSDQVSMVLRKADAGSVATAPQLGVPKGAAAGMGRNIGKSAPTLEKPFKPKAPREIVKLDKGIDQAFQERFGKEAANIRAANPNMPAEEVDRLARQYASRPLGAKNPVPPAEPTPKAKPAPEAPVAPKTTVSETHPVVETGKTNISLAEAAKHDLSPEAPDPQSWDMWQSKAIERGHNTPEGVQKILDRAKKGHEPEPDETFGLGMHVADLLATASKATGDEKTKLIDRAREIYGIRHTQSARNIAARAALHQGEYKPGLVDSLYELETGKAPDPKTSKRINAQAEKVQVETANIEKISAERKKLRNAKIPKFVEKGTPEQRIAKARSFIEKKYPRRLTGGYIDPDMLDPVAAMLRAKVEQLRGNVQRAVTELRNELGASYGWKVTDDDLYEAFQNVKKKQSLTEAEIRARNSRARATAAINREIEAASQPKSVKLAKGAGRFSQEMRMADIVNRGIDAGSNVDELIQSSSFSPVERFIANAYLAATKDPTRFRGMSVAQRASIAKKWGEETVDAMLDAGGASGSRQSGNFSIMGTVAGVMDAPARAFNELRYAGEVAADIVKKNPEFDFSDVVDQIRQPAVGGPLDYNVAMRHHDNMYKWGDVAMHTDENQLSKWRGAMKSVSAKASPTGRAVLEVLDWFFFSFSKTLVNIADKGAQATVLPYGVARATSQATGLASLGKVDKAIRAKQLAQTIRRVGIGYGLMQVGYYWPEIQALAKEYGIDAPDQPDWMKGRMIETLDKNQKPTGNVYHEESYASQILGTFFAMGAGAKARMLDDFEADMRAAESRGEAGAKAKADQVSRMKFRQWFDWLTNNTAWNQMNSLAQIADPKGGADDAGQKALSILIRMGTPSGFAKWAKLEDDVPSRQTKPKDAKDNWDWIYQAIANEMKNRTPSFFRTMPPELTRQSLPPKSKVIK